MDKHYLVILRKRPFFAKVVLRRLQVQGFRPEASGLKVKSPDLCFLLVFFEKNLTKATSG